MTSPATRRSFEFNTIVQAKVNSKPTSLHISYNDKIAEDVARWYRKIVAARKLRISPSAITLTHELIIPAARHKFGGQRPTEDEIEAFLDEMRAEFDVRREDALTACVTAGLISRHFRQVVDPETGRTSVGTDLPIRMNPDFWDDSEENLKLEAEDLPHLPKRDPSNLVEQRIAIAFILIDQSPEAATAISKAFRSEMNLLALEKLNERETPETDEDGFRPAIVGRIGDGEAIRGDID